MSPFEFARLIGVVGVLSLGSAAVAHHSYAMFDGSRTVTVKGTVAKLEWTNPHVFVWLYVPKARGGDSFDLYAFENGLTDAGTLQFDIVTEAPEVLTQPDRRTRVYTRLAKTAASEITFCSDNDRSIDPTTAKQRFDMTPPADLPPPPSR